MNYYSENDKRAAEWLRGLIAAERIPNGYVDERDINEVTAKDLEGYVQHHFFAGIGGWPYALERASWPMDRPIWTGSCPCQPFSTAGAAKGTQDARHLWPAFRKLIATCRPACIMGEQVASRMGRDWLQEVRFDLEQIQYWEGYEKNLLSLRAAKTIAALSKVLGAVVGRVERSLCRLSENLRKGLARDAQSHADRSKREAQGEGQDLPKEVHREGQGDVPGVGNCTKVQKERDAVRPGSIYRGIKCKDSAGLLRADGSSVADETREESVEFTVTRQSKARSWLYILEHPSSLLRSKRGVGRLGGRGATNDCLCLLRKECLNDERRLAEAYRAIIASSIVRLCQFGVQAHLETLGYAVGAGDICAAGISAPHIRQRLWWVADNRRPGNERGLRSGKASATSKATRAEVEERERSGSDTGSGSGGGRVADVPGAGSSGRRSDGREHSAIEAPGDSEDRGLSDATGLGFQRLVAEAEAEGRSEPRPVNAWELSEGSEGSSPYDQWEDYEWIPCGDGRARRIEPGLSPLAHGVSGRVGLLRGYGNAIVPQVAQVFIEAFMESEEN